MAKKAVALEQDEAERVHDAKKAAAPASQDGEQVGWVERTMEKTTTTGLKVQEPETTQVSPSLFPTLKP